MDSPISCPLCSQPGFLDIHSLRMTLIQVTTRQLSCPICQEVLCGLDKLTIHLVSHSLHEQLSRSCQTSNISSNLPLHGSQEALNVSHGSINVPSLGTALPAASSNKDGPVASYIVINFPPLETSENRREVPVVPNIDGQQVKDISVSTLSQSDEAMSASHEIISDKVPSSNNHEVGITSHKADAKESFEYALFPQSLLEVQNVASGLLSPKNKSPLSNTMIFEDQSTNTSGSQQLRTNTRDVANPGPKTLQKCQTSAGEVFQRETLNKNLNVETTDSSVMCGVCGLTLKDANIAMLHQQLFHQNYVYHNRHESEPLYEANDKVLCSNQWLGKQSTLNHQKEVASSLHRFPCHICNKVFRMRGSLMIHLRVAHSSSKRVDVASKLDISSSYLKPQTLLNGSKHLQPTSTNFSFQDVEMSLTQKCPEYVENKISQHLVLDPDSSLHVSKTAKQIPFQEQASVVSCPTAKTDSGLKESPLTSPVQSPNSKAVPVESASMIFPCNICNKTYSKETLLSQHMKTHDSKQWECDVCFKTFTTKYFLKKHKRLHTGEMPYNCAICNKSFTFQQSYHKHLLYHSDEKPHSCSECGRAFKELSTLHNHQRIHTGEKPWACETCGKCFRQRVSYLVHRRIHTGAMPYQCTACLKSFRYKVSQRTHKCTAQTAENESTQPSCDLLQQTIKSSSNEMDCAAAPILSSSSESHVEPHILLKKQLQQLSIKQEDHTHVDVSNLFPQFDRKEHTSYQIDINCINKSQNQMSLLEHQSTNSKLTHNAQPSQDYCGFFKELPHNDRHHNDFLSTLSSGNEVPKTVSNDCTKPNYTLSCSKNMLLSAEQQESIRSPNPSIPLPQSVASPSSDLNIDLLQDILAMVMSPSSENVSSPSSQMELLSLSAEQNDDDSESGLALRQLLYGSCDSDNKS